LRKQRKLNAKGTRKNQFESKKSNNFFAARRNITALQKEELNCKSKRRQKQANYFEINRISTVLN